MNRFLVISIPLIFLVSCSAARSNEQFAKQMDVFLSADENVGKVGSALEKFYRKKQEEQQKQASLGDQERLDQAFQNPKTIEAGNSPVRGEKGAKVTIVEFSDFQCPYCKRGSDVMSELLKQYPSDLRIVFKNLPLPFHAQALPAAKAALAAERQGKFWEMHDLLFEHQQKLAPELYSQLAKQLGLDVDQFRKDMADEELSKRIEADQDLAEDLNVHGTPGFFVNGIEVRGARPAPHFKQIIDRWLEQLGSPQK